MKWHCDDSNANGWLDMSSTSCSENNWATKNCCYAGGWGEDTCETADLLADADDVFNEWYSALGKD